MATSLMRDCPHCKKLNSIPALSPNMECDDCIIDKQYEEMNENINKKTAKYHGGITTKTIRGDASKSKQSEDDF